MSRRWSVIPRIKKPKPYTIPDEDLIAIATSCSNRQIALSAEIALRKRYPSRKTSKLLKTKVRLTESK